MTKYVSALLMTGVAICALTVSGSSANAQLAPVKPTQYVLVPTLDCSATVNGTAGTAFKATVEGRPLSAVHQPSHDRQELHLHVHGAPVDDVARLHPPQVDRATRLHAPAALRDLRRPGAGRGA